MMIEIICKFCSKPFFVYPSQMSTIRGPRLYCSMKCRANGNAARPKPSCRWCGESPKRRYQIFCSKVCKGAYQRTLKLPKKGPMIPNMMKGEKYGI